MGFKKHVSTVGVLVCLIFSLSGCSVLLVGTAAGAAGAYVWTHGNLELTVQYGVADLYAATRQAMDEQDIRVERDRHDRFGASLSGRTDAGRKVLVRISGQTEFSSKIRVRSGVFGDKEESQMIINMILRNVS